ncbi:MAG: hypothetical protein F6K24_37635, partial [Okeania sp. SIO2D1]|nr:hypothetical protein [Okeania sp. SIO2D1]NES68229.1 hypothetical protein [Okeania sp. SIO2D1]NES68888.1 hypothetical protein [Okeania sp. SIO2D1]NES70532.1 hypothetical protein [Okeania sp. SIO2D1]
RITLRLSDSGAKKAHNKIQTYCYFIGFFPCFNNAKNFQAIAIIFEAIALFSIRYI